MCYLKAPLYIISSHYSVLQTNNKSSFLAPLRFIVYSAWTLLTKDQSYLILRYPVPFPLVRDFHGVPICTSVVKICTVMMCTMMYIIYAFDFMMCITAYIFYFYVMMRICRLCIWFHYVHVNISWCNIVFDSMMSICIWFHDACVFDFMTSIICIWFPRAFVFDFITGVCFMHRYKYIDETSIRLVLDRQRGRIALWLVWKSGERDNICIDVENSCACMSLVLSLWSMALVQWIFGLWLFTKCNFVVSKFKNWNY